MIAFLSLMIIWGGATANAKVANLPPVEFVDSAECNSSSNAHRICQIFTGRFDNWDETSVADVQAALDGMPSGKLERIIDLSRHRGFKKIVFIKKSDGVGMAGTNVVGDTAYIQLDVEWFKTPLKYKKISEKTHALMHEMVHVWVGYFVGNDFYSAPFWTDLKSSLGWNYPAGLNGMVDAKEWRRHFKVRNEFKAKGEYEQAMAEDINYARSVGFPSLYSMGKLEEYFCELTTYLIYDETTEAAPPAPVINWYLKTDLKFLLQSQTPRDESLQMKDRHIDVEKKYDFVGLLYVQDIPNCTPSILKHGLVILARHCLDPVWFKGTTDDTRFSFLSLAFYPAEGGEVRIDGTSITKIYGDPGNDDLAYMEYPPELTEMKLALPTFVFMTEDNLPDSETLFTVGYPAPNKVQRLQRMVSGPCHSDGRRGQLPGYLGILIGTTCPAWYGASGSLIFSESREPGYVNVWGVLSHTFDADANGKPLPAAIKTDAWGSYTSSNFSPMWLKESPHAERRPGN